MMRLDPVDLLHVSMLLGEENVSLGRLALYQGQILFEYDTDFLDRGLEISPFKLPLQKGVMACEDRVFEGLFGVFNDSLPDGWGRLLLDRAVQARGVAYQSLTPLDRLAHVGQHAMGALVYNPDYSDPNKKDDGINLTTISREVHKVLEGQTSMILSELLQLGGSSAGARPKILVGFDAVSETLIYGLDDLPKEYEAWMIKFPSSTDMKDVGAVEYAYSLMARKAGLEVPKTRLFTEQNGQSYFGVKRFDRVGSERIHMHTLAGLLHADHQVPGVDYESILRCALSLTRNINEVVKVFRLAAFNVFTHNRDDHSKNFSFLMDKKGVWSFAPAYDLTFSYGPGREHASMVMGEGRNPGAKNLMKLAEKFQIRDAGKILEEVRDVVSSWKHFANQAGVSRPSQQIIYKELAKIS